MRVSNEMFYEILCFQVKVLKNEDIKHQAVDENYCDIIV